MIIKRWSEAESFTIFENHVVVISVVVGGGGVVVDLVVVVVVVVDGLVVVVVVVVDGLVVGISVNGVGICPSGIQSWPLTSLKDVEHLQTPSIPPFLIKHMWAHIS